MVPIRRDHFQQANGGWSEAIGRRARSDPRPDKGVAANAVQGVRRVRARTDIVGIGYRADVKGKVDTLGYSIHGCCCRGRGLKIDKQTHLVLAGMTASCWAGGGEHQALRKPDPTRTRVSVHGRSLRKKVSKTGAGAK